MSSAELGQIAVNALMLSGILALVALGFSLVWGIMNIVNLSHGAFIVIGAYLTFGMHEFWKVDPFLSIPVSMVGSSAWGSDPARAHQPGHPRSAPGDVSPDVRPGDPDRQSAELLFQGGHAVGHDALQRHGIRSGAGPSPVHPAGGARGLDRPRAPSRGVPDAEPARPRDPRDRDGHRRRAADGRQSDDDLRAHVRDRRRARGRGRLAPLDGRAVRSEPGRATTPSGPSSSACWGAWATSSMS